MTLSASAHTHSVKPITGKSTDAQDTGKPGVSDLLQDLKHQGLWRASSLGDLNTKSSTSSGFAALDHHLPDQGWPVSGVAELLCGHVGVGEFRLLLPALATLSQSSSRWLMLVRPPYIPYPPALVQAGIALERILICQPGNHRDYLWALENALSSGSCSAVMAWPGNIESKQIRRLQVASREGHSLNILFRHEREARQSSPAELRLHISPRQPRYDASTLNVRILKRRGGWESADIPLSFDDQLHRPMPDFSEILVPQNQQRIRPEPADSIDPPTSSHWFQGVRYEYQ